MNYECVTGQKTNNGQLYGVELTKFGDDLETNQGVFLALATIDLNFKRS